MNYFKQPLNFSKTNTNLIQNNNTLLTNSNNLKTPSLKSIGQTLANGIRDNHSRDYIANQVLNQVDPSLANDPEAINQTREVLVNPVINQQTSQTNANQSQLFIDGIDAEDVVQKPGTMNCYFMASIASIAEADPNFIRNAITDNNDGTYTVRFGNPQNPNATITVNRNDLSDGRSANPNELWVPVMEAAITQIVGPQNFENRMGNAGGALSYLTGSPSNQITTTNHNIEELENILLNANQNNQPIVTGSNIFETSSHRGLSSQHAYSVLGILPSLDGQEATIMLRNPEGHREWTGPESDSVNDGIFEMPLSDFQRHFGFIFISSHQP